MLRMEKTQFSVSGLDDLITFDDQVQYYAKGIVWHTGQTASRGHYKAAVKYSDGLYVFDDTTVTRQASNNFSLLSEIASNCCLVLFVRQGLEMRYISLPFRVLPTPAPTAPPTAAPTPVSTRAPTPAPPFAPPTPTLVVDD